MSYIPTSDLSSVPLSNQRPAIGPDMQYVVLPMTNANDVPFKTATYSQTYNIAPINDGSQYYVSMESCQVAMRDIPLFIFPSDLKIGVSHNLTSVSANNIETLTYNLQDVVWVPQRMGSAGANDYLFCYSYEHLVNLLNTALNAAWVASSSPGGGDNYPYCSYSEVTKLFTFVIPDAMKNAGANNRWTICCNKALYDLLNNFNWIQNGTDFYLLEDTLSSLTNNGLAENGNAASVLVQDGTTTDYFNTAESLLVVTNTILINPTYYPNPGITDTAATLNLLAEVPLDFNNNPDVARGKFTHIPPFRQFHQVTSQGPIRRFDAEIFWVDSQSNRYPIFIASTDRCTVNLGFFRKDKVTF